MIQVLFSGQPTRLQFQGAPAKNEQWLSKLDDSLQTLYKKRMGKNTPKLERELPVAVYFKPSALSPELVRRIKEVSLEGRDPQDRAFHESLFDYKNTPAAPERDRMLVVNLDNLNKLKTIAHWPEVESINDSSYWARWA